MKESYHIRSFNYGPHDLDEKDIRQQMMATAKTTPSGGITTQRLRVSAISELKELNGRDRNEDLAKS